MRGGRLNDVSPLGHTHRIANGGSRVIGPALPSVSELVLAREATSEHRASKHDLKRNWDRAEVKERLEDMVGPNEVGREGMLVKQRAFREKGGQWV